MKNIKSSVFALFGAAILSVSLFSCSNDDAATANTTTEQTLTAKPFADLKIVPGVPGFGMVSPYIGDCIEGKSFCFSNSVPGTSPVFGIGRLDNSIVRLTMSMETYQTNKEYLADNIFEVGDEFSLNQEISKELGFETETVVTKQTAKVVQENDEVFYIDLNVKQKITFDIDKLTEVHKEGNIEVLMAHKIGESEKDAIKHGMFLVKKNGVVIDEFIVKTDESTPHLKRIDFMETDFSSFLSLDLNFESKFVDVTNKRPRKKIGDCGQDVIDCFQDVYTNHGWVSVAAALTTAFIPQTAVVFAAGCVGKNC